MIDFSQVLTGLDGVKLIEPVMNADGKMNGETRSITLGRVCANAVLAAEPGARMPGGAQTLQPADYIVRLKLAERLVTASEIMLTADETVLLKRKISEAYAHLPLIAGRALMLLEPQT